MSSNPPDPNALAKAAAAPEDPSLAARRLALDYLEKVWREDLQGCPICGTNDWGINDVGNLPVRPALADLFAEQTKVYPLVVVTCKTCGYTFFLNEKWILAGGTPPGLVNDPPGV